MNLLAMLACLVQLSEQAPKYSYTPTRSSTTTTTYRYIKTTYIPPTYRTYIYVAPTHYWWSYGNYYPAFGYYYGYRSTVVVTGTGASAVGSIIVSIVAVLCLVCLITCCVCRCRANRGDDIHYGDEVIIVNEGPGVGYEMIEHGPVHGGQTIVEEVTEVKTQVHH